MTLAHHRPKQPEFVREKLLTVACELLAEHGPNAVTLDAVAQLAGVSKGGLQYHFRSKQALLDALCDQLFNEFSERYQSALNAEPETPGRHARAYVRACFDCGPIKTQRPIAQLALSSESCRERWRAMMATALEFDQSAPEMADHLFICRLAADGFWLAQIMDIYDISEERKQALLLNILNLSHGGVASIPNI